MINPEFWRGKRVFLTGHTGFKGSWLSLWLQQLGAEVTGFSLPPLTQQSLFELANVEKGMTSLIGDIRDLEKLSSALKESKAEIVFHLAAQPLVRRSYDAPVETFETNVMGTINCLEAIRNSHTVRSAVIVTTDKCYENREWVWPYRESDPMGGHDPYSSSKGCAEIATSAYRRSFFSEINSPKIATARAGNVIGGGDFAEDRLIPDIIRAAIDSRKLSIRSPHAIRPWQHVLEPLHGYLVIAEKLTNQKSTEQKYDDAWNFGPTESEACSVEKIVKTFTQKISNCPSTLDFTAVSQKHEANILRLDITKARVLLDWQPQLSLDECLKWTADWYGAFLRGQDIKQITKDQIGVYSEKVFNERAH